MQPSLQSPFLSALGRGMGCFSSSPPVWPVPAGAAVGFFPSHWRSGAMHCCWQRQSAHQISALLPSRGEVLCSAGTEPCARCRVQSSISSLYRGSWPGDRCGCSKGRGSRTLLCLPGQVCKPEGRCRESQSQVVPKGHNEGES